MEDFRNASVAAAQRNLDRYCRLLATPLTDLEREYIHRRIAEVRRSLVQLGGSEPAPPGTAVA